MSTPPPPLLELRNLSKRFGDVVAVAGVSERIGRGEYFCIVGPSGCGKTTLLRLIAGFEEPDTGEVALDGVVLNELPPERRDVNVVFQSYALFPHLSVFDNVAFGLRMKRQPAALVRSRTEEALRLVHLDREPDRYPAQLSGGQQQRVALARALVNRPKALLLDEPLSALDRNLRLAMQEELRALQRETGLTFVHITHDQSEALSMADRLAVMRAGELVQVGEPRRVYRRPANRFVAEFLGTANLLDARLVGERPARVAVDGLVELEAAELPESARGRPRVTVSIRPEALRLAPAEASAPNTFSGTLRRLAFAGAVVEAFVAVGAHELVLHLPGRAATEALTEGQTVVLQVPPGDVVVLPPD